MGRRRKHHYKQLPSLLEGYANKRAFRYLRFNEYHIRVSDEVYNTIDIWTTAKYYAKETNYYQMENGKGIIERQGESGIVPTDKEELYQFLDKYFYPMYN